MRHKTPLSELEESGVFETIRLYNGKPFRLEEHLERLYNSAKSTGFFIDKRRIKKLICSRLRGKVKAHYLRVSLSRNGKVGIIFRPQKFYPEQLYENGIEMVSVPVKRSFIESQNPKIKSRDFLWGVMASLELTNFKRGFEAVLLNRDGFVTEGTVSNIFIVKDNGLITPPCHCGILEGITRQYVIELAKKLKFRFKEEILTRHQIYNADEAFLTNTSMEIMPVVKFDGRTIGSGRPGKITKRLIAAFRSNLRNRGFYG